MILVIQPQLAERAAFEAVRKDSSLLSLYERRFAACHDERDAHRRDQGFIALHEQLFDKLGYRDLIATLANEFAHVRRQVNRLMVAQAPSPSLQSAELFGAPGRYAIMMAVSVTTLLDRDTFQYWARHELLHIDDILDPSFGYDATKCPHGSTAAAKNLVRDRYTALWALSADARLMNRGLAPVAVRQKRREELFKVFSLSDSHSSGYVFERFWEQGRWFAPSHATMLNWAQQGLPDVPQVNPTSGSDDARRTIAGAACPLCGFPTFEWADSQGLHGVCHEIQADFPSWHEALGACSRCVEVYHAIKSDQSHGLAPMSTR